MLELPYKPQTQTWRLPKAKPGRFCKHTHPTPHSHSDGIRVGGNVSHGGKSGESKPEMPRPCAGGGAGAWTQPTILNLPQLPVETPRP